MNSAEEPLVLPLTDDERYLLSHGVRDWDTDGGPALATDPLAQAMGFADAEELCLRGPELADAILSGTPMSGTDWVRALAAAEIAFASDVLGTGLEWTAINGGQEAYWFAVLRRLQSKISHLHRGV
jgi:hypothetical protein